jgi:hypothetical protein
MTASAPHHPPAARSACVTAGPWAGQVINVFFAATVVLFLVGVFTLGPVS